ncbi:Ulp1 protease family [Theobroma cacao]|nr:Ulp1 protease family [Theobroma cacao]
MLHTTFPTEDARSTMEIPNELWGYLEGEKPTYGKKWEDVNFILTPCNVGGHWVVAKISLVRWMIKVVDSVRTSDAKDNGVRVAQMTHLTTIMPIICHQASYFNKTCQKTWDLMRCH